jgi:putative membrane protein (TIGR04086 family)
MVVNKKVTGKAVSVPMGLLIGQAIALIVSVLGSIIAANMILTETLEASAIGYCAIVILMLASALCALISAWMIKRRWMIVCLGAGGIYYLLLLATTAMFFGAQYQGMGVTALVVLGGSGAVGLLGLQVGNGKRSKRAKHHFR